MLVMLQFVVLVTAAILHVAIPKQNLHWGKYITYLETKIISHQPRYNTLMPYYRYGTGLVGTLRKECGYTGTLPAGNTKPGQSFKPCGKITLTDANQYLNSYHLYARTYKTVLLLTWIIPIPNIGFMLNLTFVHVNLSASPYIYAVTWKL